MNYDIKKARKVIKEVWGEIDERTKLLMKFLTILNTIPFKERGYNQERWRNYWIKHFEKLMLIK